MPNYLGIDYGRSHVGIALAQTPVAEPIEVVSLGQSIDRIGQLAKTFQVETVVIGLSEGEMAIETQKFGRQLETVTNLEIVYHDETLTSYAAKQKLRHKKKKARQGPDHHYAAALILQDYLDTHL